MRRYHHQQLIIQPHLQYVCVNLLVTVFTVFTQYSIVEFYNLPRNVQCLIILTHRAVHKSTPHPPTLLFPGLRGSEELLKFDKAPLSFVMKTDTLDCVFLKQSATLILAASRAL